MYEKFLTIYMKKENYCRPMIFQYMYKEHNLKHIFIDMG